MADRPILFSAPMVRALLAGTKTQTRRTITPQPPEGARYSGIHFASNEPDSHFFNSPSGPHKVRHRIAVGDRLYVREHWRSSKKLDGYGPNQIVREELPFNGAPVYYAADDAVLIVTESEGLISRSRAAEIWPQHSTNGLVDLNEYSAAGKARISLHMPREFSRLTLHVTEVRVQRLQDISEDDAKAEGIAPEGESFTVTLADKTKITSSAAWRAYRVLWNSINGEEAWDTNPWVAAYTFTVEKSNIDGAA